MVAAFKHQRNSIGVEVDPEYCRMAARYLKAESNNLFSKAELIFERVFQEEGPHMVKEDSALYDVRPARRRLK